MIYIKRLLKVQWFVKKKKKCLRNKNTNYVKSNNLKILLKYSQSREACKKLIQKVMIARDNNIDIEIRNNI